MPNINKRERRYSLLRHTLTGLLSIAAALLLALGVYILSLWFSDYFEAVRIERERNASIVYASEGSGIGRDITLSIGQNTVDFKESGEPSIIAVDEDYVETWGQLLPVINQNTAISSISAIMVVRGSGQVLYSKDAARSTYPASLTKLMTALLCIENCPDLDKVITITEEMTAGLLEANASSVGFSIGEEVPLIDVLYGLLLPSGADAANAIAFECAGSIDAFVDMMNSRAKELGMRGTNYTNAHGLHDVKMRTTAEDTAKLFEYLLNFDIFKKISGSKFHTTASTNKHGDGITFYNTLFNMLTETECQNGAVIKGGKTGTTTPAGQCLASYCELGGQEFILVTLGAFGYGSGEYLNAADALNLYGLLKMS